MRENLHKKIYALSKTPTEKGELDVWLQMTSAIEFLDESASDDDILVYCSADAVFLHAVLAPRSAVFPLNKDDLLRWDFNATSSWSVWTNKNTEQALSIEPPLGDSGSKCLRNGEQLVFVRDFDSGLGEAQYFELLQKFIHLMDLHFVPERSAYCRLDERGDIEESVKMVRPKPKGGDTMSLVTIKREMLQRYAALTDSVIVRTFDFTRVPPNFAGWSEGQGTQVVENQGLIYEIRIVPSYASYIRGVQVLVPQISQEEVVRHFNGEPERENRYESFIALDWKNGGRICEISCAPGATANYFTESELPFELSPVFFRPEVLMRYKNDRDKYQLRERTIACRNSWYLKTYDINEAGQVHTYLVYLRDLPYEEQLYWKGHNEKPKAPISARSFASDFEGKWHVEYDPLRSLKEILGEWSEKTVPWWTVRDETLMARILYPVTASVDEWVDELLHLDQLVVEGFEKKWIASQCLAFGRRPRPEYGSLKLIEEYLLAKGFEQADATKVVEPLKRLHHYRSKLAGHASGDDALEIKKLAIKEHGSYGKQFRSLCKECDESLRTVFDAFASGGK